MMARRGIFDDHKVADTSLADRERCAKSRSPMDGGDATKILHDRHPDPLKEIRGISEETRAGVNRLYAIMGDGSLRVPSAPEPTSARSNHP